MIIDVAMDIPFAEQILFNQTLVEYAILQECRNFVCIALHSRTQCNLNELPSKICDSQTVNMQDNMISADTQFLHIQRNRGKLKINSV